MLWSPGLDEDSWIPQATELLPCAHCYHTLTAASLAALIMVLRSTRHGVPGTDRTRIPTNVLVRAKSCGFDDHRLSCGDLRLICWRGVPPTLETLLR